MANSRFDYVREFESDDRILPNCWIVIRIDGKAFHKFTEKHKFEKPNDESGLNLMSYAAISVMEEFHDIVIAYGQSDEYSFVLRKSANVYNRRASKILTCVNSLFTSAYVFNWSRWFPSQNLLYTPSFDARIVLYPSDENLRDYLSWRQADTHINNLYNTAFWKLVLETGLTNSDAEKELCGTFSADKNELLFSKFGINYNNLPEMYRKGTILLRKSVTMPSLKNDSKRFQLIVPFFVDLIRDKFWQDHSEILSDEKPADFELDNLLEHSLIQKQLEKLQRKYDHRKDKLK